MLKLVHRMAAWPHQVWLEVAPLAARHQTYSNDIARRNAYLSEHCLTTIVAWLNSEDTLPTVCPCLGDATVWEFLPGAVIQVGTTKLALIPSEIGDVDRFFVPFEWVDISDWAADYYLAVQMNLEDDEPWLRIWGFASHQQIKSGAIDLKKHLYRLDRSDLTENLNVLWAMESLSTTDVLSQAKPLPTLTLDRLEELLAKLGKPTAYSPRLEVPFAEWASVLTNPNWRKLLYDRRQPVPELKPSSNLRDWIKRLYTSVNEGWQTVEAIVSPPQLIPARGAAPPISTLAEIAPILRLVQSSQSEQIRQQAAGVLGEIGANHPDTVDILVELLQTAQKEETRWQAALSLGKIAPHHPLAGVRRARLIDLGVQLGNTSIALIVAIMPKPNDRLGIFLQLQAIDPQLNLPPNLKISVLSISGETQLSSISREQDKSIELRFTPPSGTRFQVQIELDQSCFIEEFST